MAMPMAAGVAASTGGVAHAAGVVDAADAAEDGGVDTRHVLRRDALIVSSRTMVGLLCAADGGIEELLSAVLLMISPARRSCGNKSRSLFGGITQGMACPVCPLATVTETRLRPRLPGWSEASVLPPERAILLVPVMRRLLPNCGSSMLPPESAILLVPVMWRLPSDPSACQTGELLTHELTRNTELEVGSAVGRRPTDVTSFWVGCVWVDDVRKAACASGSSGASVDAVSPPSPCTTGLVGKGDGGLELCDRWESSAALASSDASWTAGKAPDELDERMPMDGSERDDPMTESERSECETAKDCRSGVVGGELRCKRPRVCGVSLKIPNSAGSEFEWPIMICPDRNEEEWDEVEDRPNESCEDVFLYKSFKSLLQRGQKVALMNHASTHFAWNTCAQSSTRQMS